MDIDIIYIIYQYISYIWILISIVGNRSHHMHEPRAMSWSTGTQAEKPAGITLDVEDLQFF